MKAEQRSKLRAGARVRRKNKGQKTVSIFSVIIKIVTKK